MLVVKYFGDNVCERFRHIQHKNVTNIFKMSPNSATDITEAQFRYQFFNEMKKYKSMKKGRVPHQLKKVYYHLYES